MPYCSILRFIMEIHNKVPAKSQGFVKGLGYSLVPFRGRGFLFPTPLEVLS